MSGHPLAPSPGAAGWSSGAESRRTPVARLRARLQVPLYRNGYALVASSGLTSVLGLVFWLVAAREYSAASVGVSAALIAAMTLLADLSHLNLKSALNRFLPRAGAGSARFARRAYLVALCVSALAGAIFIAGLAFWSPELEFLRDRPELALWFVVGTMAWTVFVLQDSVLAGIRQAGWVPAENLVFSLLKLGLLVALAATAPVLGAWVAWSAAVLVVIAPMNLIMFRRLIPRHVHATQGLEEPISPRRVARYVAADYVAYAIWSATIGVLPLVVLHVAGAEASAYFYISWAIAYSLYLASSGMGQSLLAEASLAPERLGEHARRAAAETARLVVPAVAVVVLGAPFILGLLGDDYSGEAVTLLRLLALSAVPFVVVATYVNVMRVRRHMRAVVATYAALSAIVLGVGLPLLATLGIVGLGIAWLAAQTAVAGTLVARRVRGEQVLRGVSAVRRATLRRWRLARSAGGLDPVLGALAAPGGEAPVVHGHAGALNDVLVSFAGPAGADPTIVVKRGCTPAGVAAVAREERNLLELRRHRRLGGWRTLIPAPLAGGAVDGRAFVAESVVPGRPAAELLREGLPSERFLTAAARAIGPLHDATSTTTTVDEGLLDAWVHAPLAQLREAAAAHSGLAEQRAAIECLAAELRSALASKRVTTSWVHGDLCPDNVMVSEDGEAVEGIVDWEQASRRGIADVDLLHLLVTTRMVAEGRELGAAVAGLLGGPFADSPRSQGGPSRRALLLLAWLHHVSGNLTKSEHYGRSRPWVRRNIDPVLAALLGPAGAAALDAAAPRALTAAVVAQAARATATRLLPFAPIAAGLGLWVVALGEIDVRAMSDLGLVSVLPATFVAALVVLTASFAAFACARPQRTGLLTVHLMALVAVLHATPAILYGTLRYSWAWKHLGIVDYIERRGGVQTDIDTLGVYHNWPGFFGVDALLGGLGDVTDMVAIATWGSVFFNILNLAALLFLFSSLTRDRRVLWVGAWLYFVASWVGQDYFAPQSFAFFLYVVLLGVVLRWLGREPVAAGRTRAGPLVVAVLLLVAIAASHALTSVMAFLALAAITVTGACAVRTLPLIAGAITLAWNLLFATHYVEGNVASTFDSIRLPWTTTKSSLSATNELSDGQALVALVSRGLAAAMVALALVGAVRAFRARSLHRGAAVLAAAPFTLFAAGNYDGEILFRIYLFALPFLAFLAAHAVLARRDARGSARRSALATTAAGVALLSLFLFAYYGKDRQYYFTAGEVDAARWVYTHAPPDSLLIEGTRNYPGQFKNYEHFTYVTLSREPRSSHARFAARPEAVFSRWMSDRSYRGAFLIITRSQKAEVEEMGVLPPRSLDRIERSLLASPRFRAVFRNRDATVFELADRPGPSTLAGVPEGEAAG